MRPYPPVATLVFGPQLTAPPMVLGHQNVVLHALQHDAESLVATFVVAAKRTLCIAALQRQAADRFVLPAVQARQYHPRRARPPSPIPTTPRGPHPCPDPTAPAIDVDEPRYGLWKILGSSDLQSTVCQPRRKSLLYPYELNLKVGDRCG